MVGLVAGCARRHRVDAGHRRALGRPGDAAESPDATTPLRVGLGYIPSVQFAPFYLADQAGYYADAGLEVTFENGNDADLIRLVGSGDYDVGIADGTSVIPAVSQGIPVRYLATIYADFPSVVFAKPDAGITTAADLDGQEAGHPGQGRQQLGHAPGAARARSA